MIKEIITTPERKYGKYFLSLEAPGDEETPVKSNLKVIDVKPNRRARIDFTDGAEDEGEEDPSEETEVPEEEQPVEDDENYDFTTDAEDPLQQMVNATNNEINSDNVDFTQDTSEQTPSDEGGVQNGTDPSVQVDGEEQPTDATDNADGPDLSDDTEDFSDDSGEEEQETPQQEPQNEEKKGPGLEYDSTRKYVLFKNYVSLITAIDNYIEKLENSIKDDININTLIKQSTDKLREIKNLAYEYVTLKFEVSSYVQSLLFFQNLVITVEMVFNLFSKFDNKFTNNTKKNTKTLN